MDNGSRVNYRTQEQRNLQGKGDDISKVVVLNIQRGKPATDAQRTQQKKQDGQRPIDYQLDKFDGHAVVGEHGDIQHKSNQEIYPGNQQRGNRNNDPWKVDFLNNGCIG